MMLVLRTVRGSFSRLNIAVTILNIRPGKTKAVSLSSQSPTAESRYGLDPELLPSVVSPHAANRPHPLHRRRRPLIAMATPRPLSRLLR